MIISPTDLQYFIEISHTKNVSRAAERIGISQPSLTLSIKRIEEALGVEVFIRSKKGVSLTKAGVNLLKHSKEMYQLWDQIKSEATGSVNEIKGQLTIGCHPSVGLYTLDRFLPSILHKNNDLEFQLIHNLSRKITEEVISLKIDIGLVINPVQHPDLIIQNLLKDVVTLWRSKKATSTVDTKKGTAVLICDPELLQTQNIKKKLNKKGVKYSRVITSSSLENITSLIKSGAGIGILPTRVAKKLADTSIEKIPSAPVFNDILSLIYRVENRNVKSIQYLIGEISRKLK